jgi:arginyl-tRNA synthetase
MSGFRTVRQKLTERLEAATSELWRSAGQAGAAPEVQLTPPKQAEHGDYATSTAMLLAKGLKQNPRAIAEKLQRALGNADGLLAKTEIAGPGFLNLFVADGTWRQALADILAAGEDFIKSDFGGGKRVLMEYVSANPTGPLHIAHGRGAVTGDVIANLLAAAGFKVDREYYINDLGNQIDVMARSIYLRYGELFGRTFTAPEDFYPGEYITEMATELKAAAGDRYLERPEAEWLEPIRDFGIERMMARIKDDLGRFGVRFDRFVSEKELTSRVGADGVIARLEKAGHIYEQEGKKWFRTTAFGDDKDRVVIREDGRPTYFASDITYHAEKMSRGYEELIDIWGADHGGYIARVKAALAGLGYDPQVLTVLLVQMVSLSRGGEAVRMGKRLGTAVWLRDVIDEAGMDATRYFFVMRSSASQLDFDLELATKKSLDNPVYYAQMGHARMCSIERKARAAGVAEPALGEGALDALVLPAELNLIKTMLLAPEVVRDAGVAHEPHRVVHFIQELIGQFHSYYTQYKNTERVISDDAAKTRARLLLCRALRDTLHALLSLLGVGAPEQMILTETEGEGD